MAEIRPSIFIPVQNSEEQVQVFVDNLPHHYDVLELLKAEQAPLDLWLAFAREYFKKGDIGAFLDILKEGSSPDVERFYADVQYERIAILNALGAYFTNLGKMNKKKDEYFIKAVDFYNKAARINPQEVTTWIGKGQLQLAKGELDQAEEMFKMVLHDNPNHVPALLGQACVLFNKNKFNEALANYKKVLEIHPQCPASVRLGIGLCHYRLQHTSKSRQSFHSSKARQAFERVLQLDEENVEALVGLAMLDINSDQLEGIRRGMEKFVSAFEIYPYCTMSLNHLSNHYLYTNQHHIVEKLSDVAISSTTHSFMHAETYYNLARSCHAMEDYNKAAAYYRASMMEISNSNDFILPQYGLAQILLKNNDIKAALTMLEKILSIKPNFPEALKMAGHICAQQGKNEQALSYFSKATDLDSSDADAWIEKGELLVRTDLNAALESLIKARSLLNKKHTPIPPELLNNIAVLYHERKEYDKAIELYMEALGPGPWIKNSKKEKKEEIEKEVEGEGEGEKDEKIVLEKTTMVFNLALLHEKNFDFDRASFLYSLILKSHPKYADAYLRKACIAILRNDFFYAKKQVKQALTLNSNDLNALLIKSTIEILTDDLKHARETLKQILSMDENYAPALVALGNWNLKMRFKSNKDATVEAMHLEKAKEYFQKTLKLNLNNMYAANGIGCVLAEKGNFDLAKDIFTLVQETAVGNNQVDMPDVWINLAHVYLAKGDFALSVKMYQNCLRRFYHGSDSRVLLFLAHAHYEAKELKQCKKALQKALHSSPSDPSLRFNIAATMQKRAEAILKQEKRTASMVCEAVSEIKLALHLFEQLGKVGGHQGHGFDAKKSSMHVQYCQHMLDMAKIHLEAAEREEQQNKQKIEIARQQALAMEAKKKAEEERRMQEERERREEEERKAAIEEEEFRRRKESWKRVTKMDDGDERERREERKKGEKKKGKEERRGKKEGKRRKKRREEEDFIDDGEFQDNEEDKVVQYYQDDMETNAMLEDDVSDHQDSAPKKRIRGRELEDSEGEEEYNEGENGEGGDEKGEKEMMDMDSFENEKKNKMKEGSEDENENEKVKEEVAKKFLQSAGLDDSDSE